MYILVEKMLLICIYIYVYTYIHIYIYIYIYGGAPDTYNKNTYHFSTVFAGNYQQTGAPPTGLVGAPLLLPLLLPPVCRLFAVCLLVVSREHRQQGQFRTI